jgi:hypothetical protein
VNDLALGGARELVAALGRGRAAGVGSQRRSRCASGLAAHRNGTSLGVAAN